MLEIINNGEIKIYDNEVGVLTNSPDYDWHLKNLNNYINLYSGNAKNYTMNNHKIFSFGAGTEHWDSLVILHLLPDLSELFTT